MQAIERRKRAVSVIRVSHVGKREAEKFISPEDQMRIVNKMCDQHDWDHIASFTELDQSGLRTKFEKRKGLYPATRMIEEGDADVVVMAFFDRMARNIVVQMEFLGRIGQAAGEVWADDWGQIRTDAAAAILAAGVMGLFVMFVAQSTAEKTLGPKERAIARGIPTFPHIPAGYRKDDNPESPTYRQLVIFEPEAKLVRRAFEMRAAGASYHAIRDFLREQGLMRSTRGVQEMLKNRIYLGELHHGNKNSKGVGKAELKNLAAHEPIIDRDQFDQINDARKMRVRGPRGEAESIHARLLSRQGILRCDSCRRAMIVSSSIVHGKRRVTYRCPTISDCTAKAAIMADNVDAYIAAYLRKAREEGTFSAHDQMEVAVAESTAASVEYVQVMKNLATQGTPEAAQVIEDYRQKAAAATQRVDQLRRAFGASATRSMADFDKLSLTGQRDIVRAVIQRILVRPGRGPIEARVLIEPFEV